MRSLRFFMVLFLFFTSSFVLVSCTQSVNIPKGKIGVLLSYGKVEGHAEGPFVFNRTRFVDSVVIFDKRGSFSLGGSDFVYDVKDPEVFYIKTRLHEGLMNIINENYTGDDRDVSVYVNDVIRERSIPITVRQRGKM